MGPTRKQVVTFAMGSTPAATTWFLAAILLHTIVIYIASTSAQQQQQNQNLDKPIDDATRTKMCAFFAGGRAEIPEQGDWQKQGLCTTNTTMHWLDVAARSCISCQTGRNVCKKPPMLLFHQFLDTVHPTLWHANLLSAQSVLVRVCRDARVCGLPHEQAPTTR